MVRKRIDFSIFFCVFVRISKRSRKRFEIRSMFVSMQFRFTVFDFVSFLFFSFFFFVLTVDFQIFPLFRTEGLVVLHVLHDHFFYRIMDLYENSVLPILSFVDHDHS